VHVVEELIADEFDGSLELINVENDPSMKSLEVLKRLEGLIRHSDVCWLCCIEKSESCQIGIGVQVLEGRVLNHNVLIWVTCGFRTQTEEECVIKNGFLLRDKVHRAIVDQASAEARVLEEAVTDGQLKPPVGSIQSQVAERTVARVAWVLLLQCIQIVCFNLDQGVIA